MNKFESYRYLSKIKQEGVDVSPYVKKVTSSDSDNVSIDVVKFIDSYYPQKSLSTIHDIYEKRRKNPLYKNLVNESASNEDKAIALSSFITRAMITISTMNDTVSIKRFSEDLGLESVLTALSEYCVNHNSDKLNTVFEDVRNVMKSTCKK